MFLVDVSPVSHQCFYQCFTSVSPVCSHEYEDWKTVENAEIEFSDINKEKLSELIFGPLGGQFISSFLQVLSYCSGISF